MIKKSSWLTSSSNGVGGPGGGVVDTVDNVDNIKPLFLKGIPTLFGEVLSTQPEDP